MLRNPEVRVCIFQEDSGNNPEGTRQEDYLEVRHPPKTAFDLCQGLATDVPPQQVQLRDQHGLCDALRLPESTDGGSDDVSRVGHVLNSELDVASQ